MVARKNDEPDRRSSVQQQRPAAIILALVAASPRGSGSFLAVWILLPSFITTTAASFIMDRSSLPKRIHRCGRRCRLFGAPRRPPQKTLPGSKPPQQRRRRPSGETKQQQRHHPKLPDLATQLCYARKGHAVIRRWMDPDGILSIRKDLLAYGQKRELSAWQQKVAVASSGKAVKAGSTVEECREQLDALGVPANELPFLQYFNTWRTLDSVKELAVAAAETAAVLMDRGSVRLYQDAVFWKRVGDGPTPWHVDARMAPFDTQHLVTLWIPLQHNVETTGLVFCSGSHSDFALPYWNPDPDSWRDLEERYGEDACTDYMPLRIGDATAHSGWTLHCADPAVQEERWALALSYVDARAPVRDLSRSGGDREDEWSYREWVHDVPRGSYEWDHPLVPIVWSSPETKTVVKQQ
jgi:hypothetical protein